MQCPRERRWTDVAFGRPTGRRQRGVRGQVGAALRGRESSAKAKWQDHGRRRFMYDIRGTLRTELNFSSGEAEDVRRLPPESRRRLPTIAAKHAVGLGRVRRCDPDCGRHRHRRDTIVGGATPNPGAAQTDGFAREPAETTVTDISVDELCDKLNSVNMGGIKVGDQFRVTDELVASEYWGTGASGDRVRHGEREGGSKRLRGRGAMSAMRMDGRTARGSSWS